MAGKHLGLALSWLLALPVSTEGRPQRAGKLCAQSYRLCVDSVGSKL